MEGIVLKLRTADGREVRPRTRSLSRLGRLAPPVGDATNPDRHVRCACEECGAHLLGNRTDGGGATGICLVCGSVSIRPL